MNKIRNLFKLLVILGLPLLSGSVGMHPPTLLRVAKLTGTSMYHVPDNYYNYASIIPAGVDPYEWLDNLKWAKAYEPDSWDCSNMAMYMEWILENAGVKTVIGAGWGHAWVFVWRTDMGEWWVYECVDLEWVSPRNNSRYFGPPLVWYDAYAIEEHYGDHHWEFAREWCWWTDVSGIPRTGY